MFFNKLNLRNRLLKLKRKIGGKDRFTGWVQEVKKIYKSFLILILIISVAVTGCKKGKEQTDKKEETEENIDLSGHSYVIKVGDETVNYNEAMVYVLLLKQQYEPNLGKEIWDYNTEDGINFEDMAKEEVMDEIIQLKIIKDKAKEFETVLDEDEKEEALETATRHFNVISAKDKENYGITLGTLERVYRDNLLAGKVFDVVTSDTDTEVSDEEARQITIYQILIKTTKQDLNGETIPLTKKQKQDALKKAKKLLKQGKKAESFKTFAKENTEDKKAEYTFGRGDMNKEVEEAAFALKKGQFSGVVVSEDGYHILYCANDFDENATADKKEEIILDRQTKYFQDTYKGWLDDYKVTVNEKEWNKINFNETAE